MTVAPRLLLTCLLRTSTFAAFSCILQCQCPHLPTLSMVLLHSLCFSKMCLRRTSRKCRSPIWTCVDSINIAWKNKSISGQSGQLRWFRHVSSAWLGSSFLARLWAGPSSILMCHGSLMCQLGGLYSWLLWSQGLSKKTTMEPRPRSPTYKKKARQETTEPA